MSDKSEVSRIRKLIDLVRNAVDGDFSLHIENSGRNDEIDSLADAINQLVANTGELIDGKSRNEAARMHFEEKYRRLETNIPGMVYLFAMHPDGSFSFPYVNDASQILFNVSPEDLKRDATLIIGLIHPDDRERFESSVKRSAETLQPWREILRFVVKGELRWYDCMSTPELEPDGDILWDGIILEVTDRERAVKSLRESEHLLNNIIDQNPHPIWISDDKGTLIRINKACCDLLNIREDQVIGKYNVLKDDIVIEQGFLPLVESVFSEGKVVSFTIIYDSARLKQIALDRTAKVILEVTISPVRDESGTITNAVVMHRDVTAARNAEAALRQAKAYSEKLIEAANAMIVVLDGNGRIRVFNKTAEKITGYTRNELIGHNWFEVLVPKDVYPGVLDAYRKASKEGLPRIFENPILTKAGEERFISWRNTELLEDGVFAGSISYGIDITERKQLEEQLLQSQKMEAIGKLAGGVAHDFNNMLSVILGHSELIRSALPSDHPLFNNILEIEKAGIRTRDITGQLLAFSRKQIIAPKAMNLNQLISQINRTLIQLIGENIELRFIPENDLWKIRFDPSQIDQVLINLAVNARDAMPEGGTLTIETSNVYLDEVYCRLHAECAPGHYVLLEVTDDGVGMDREMLSHVFESFFTTKELGKGTGLGLSTVYGIIKQNRGFITIYSEPERGTSFKIYIPRLIKEEEEEKKKEDAPLEFHSGTILLVEDNEMVRRMTSEVLEKIGYTVLKAGTPLEAMAICEKGDRHIDLLITDVVMPQMSGPKLNEKIQGILPGTRVLFMSGYTENIIVRHGVLKESVHFVQKPFSMNDFARKVREAMEEARE